MINKIKYRIQVIRRLRPYAAGVKKLYIINFCAAVIVLFLGLAVPLFYSLFIEKVILGQKLAFLFPVIIGYASIQLMNTGITFLRNYCQYRVNNQVTVKMKLKILENLLKQPFTEYEKINVGEKKMVIDDAVLRVRDFTNIQTTEYLINFLKMILLFVLLFVLEWHLALILIIAIPLTFWINHVIGKKARKNDEKIWHNDEAMGGYIYSALNGWREIRALNLEDTCQGRFMSYAEKYSRLFLVFIEYWVARVMIIPKIKDEFLMQFLLYFLGGLLIFHGNITIGALLVFAQYYSQLVDTVQAVVTADTDLQEGTVYYDRALSALEENPVEEEKLVSDLPDCELVFDHVSFSYEDGDLEVLNNFSMEIHQGERVGIVGESGRGKTTLLKMIVGMLEPTSGNILFGNYNIKQISLQAVHRKVGFVLQENLLFNTTIHENLLYGDESATEADMQKACKRAFIDEFIDGLPDGYETVVGEKGIKLSGGQKQRLVLARLFLRDVDMFIFDEATSALDQHAENEVQQAIKGIGRDKTIIVVSHRASSLNLCDRLIYL